MQNSKQTELLTDAVIIEDRGEFVECARLDYRIMCASGFLIDRGPRKPKLLDHAPAPTFSIVRLPVESAADDKWRKYNLDQQWDTLLTSKGY